MVFKDTPATFNRVIFAIVRWIVNQYDFKVIFVRKINYPAACSGVVYSLLSANAIGLPVAVTNALYFYEVLTLKGQGRAEFE